MELKDIQSLIKLVSNSKIDEVTVEKESFRVKIRKHAPQVIQTGTAVAPTVTVEQTPAAIAAPAQAAPAAPATETPAAETASNLIEIKSPMIGTFYRKPSPDKPNFAEVGTEVAPGQVVCIIEAMKLFNEIESEVSGKIVKILVEDSAPVEYDQPLFLVEPA